MTKSLGRTYSLLDFSGREMHYWPGNLPRRRAVPRRRRRGITRHIVRAVLSRVTPACSRVSRGRNVPPPSSPLIFSLRRPPPDSSPPLSPSPLPAVEPLRLHCIVLEGTPGETSPHVRKVTARPLLPQTAVVAVGEHEHEKF